MKAKDREGVRKEAEVREFSHSKSGLGTGSMSAVSPSGQRNTDPRASLLDYGDYEAPHIF